jgi:hypothetical protein
MFDTSALLLLALFIAPIFFAVITGMALVPIGIITPILMALGLGRGEFMAYFYFLYVAAFLGYFFTPIHMCQIFTNEYMGLKARQLYRVYPAFAAFMILWLIVSYFALSNILPALFG